MFESWSDDGLRFIRSYNEISWKVDNGLAVTTLTIGLLSIISNIERLKLKQNLDLLVQVIYLFKDGYFTSSILIFGFASSEILG